MSLPLGRRSVFDDDPGRHEFGITRHCERQLLQRGIRSYPPLIKSMQPLTRRGIALAQLFRAQGCAVIEGYPGGAQDLLGVPRKSKSRPLLAAGLAALGLEGPFTEGPLSHDELDAITAALVGHFYRDGQFEALGGCPRKLPDYPQAAHSAVSRRGVVGPSGLVRQHPALRSCGTKSRGGCDLAQGERLIEK